MAGKSWIAVRGGLPALFLLAVLLGGLSGCGGGGREADPTPTPSPSPTPPPVTMERVRQTVFSDVPDQAPWRDAVSYMACVEVLEGLDRGSFDPERDADRGCVVTALFRLLGDGREAGDSPFADVDPGDWYAPGAAWAKEAGVVEADGEGLFHPQGPVDRGELAVFLYRCARAQGLSLEVPEDPLGEFWDAGKVSGETRAALAWCVSRGLFAPLTARELHPGYPVTRAQLAQVLTAWRAPEEPVAGVIAARQAVGTGRSQEAHGELQGEIEQIARRYGVIGLQAAVVERGWVTDVFTYGWADKSQGEAGAMTRDNKLRVASISKAVVAMNAMAMAQRGEVELDSSIGPYWDCQAQNRAYPQTPVSIRSILTHTSSIPMYGDDVSRRYEAVRRRLANGDFAGLEPGSIHSWGYNNYAFGVLGMTLELAGGRRYDSIARENFFTPLDIDAGVVPGELDHPELVATLYRHSGEVGWSAESQRQSRYRYDPGDYGNYFCGGLTASATDIARLFSLLAMDGCYEGQRLLTAQAVAQMEAPLGQPYGQSFVQCAPLRYQEELYGRDRLYYLTGSAYGAFNLASYDPETGDAVVVLTTGASPAKDSRDIYAVCGEISQLLYAAIAP